jgi:hypothetical protein
VPHGTDEAEDRQSNFYDARVNLVNGQVRVKVWIWRGIDAG